MLTFDASTDYCFVPGTAHVKWAPIDELKGVFVRAKVEAGRITSKELKQKPKSFRSKKRTARRSAILKSASWYASAALSIGVSKKSETSTH
jgi:hypothetical protein